MLKSRLALWCLAYNIDPKCLDEECVKYPLDDEDPVDTLRAVMSVRHPLPGRIMDTIGPLEQLQFIGLF